MEKQQLTRHCQLWTPAEDLLVKETLGKAPASHLDSQITYLSKKIGRTEVAVRQRYHRFFSKKSRHNIRRVDTTITVEPETNLLPKFETDTFEFLTEIYSTLTFRQKVALIFSGFSRKK